MLGYWYKGVVIVVRYKGCERVDAVNYMNTIGSSFFYDPHCCVARFTRISSYFSSGWNGFRKDIPLIPYIQL